MRAFQLHDAVASSFDQSIQKPGRNFLTHPVETTQVGRQSFPKIRRLSIVPKRLKKHHRLLPELKEGNESDPNYLGVNATERPLAKCILLEDSSK
jgi:hypothetical protein